MTSTFGAVLVVCAIFALALAKPAHIRKSLPGLSVEPVAGYFRMIGWLGLASGSALLATGLGIGYALVALFALITITSASAAVLLAYRPAMLMHAAGVLMVGLIGYFILQSPETAVHIRYAAAKACN